MIRLGVNIDHVATLRQARYRQHSGASAPEPDPLLAARICMAAGAHSLTVHLREDRRHIQDDDVLRIAREFRDRLNLEMAATPAVVDFALRLKPSEVCLVPENRAEVTTEGGARRRRAGKGAAAGRPKIAGGGHPRQPFHRS